MGELQVDFVAIDDRLREVDQKLQSTKYSTKCSSLAKTFTTFLASCPNSPDVYNATPEDVRRFLVWKDSFGKTQVHSIECRFVGAYGIQECSCPARLAAGSVEGIVYQLKRIFDSQGRQGEWNSGKNSGNPMMSSVVRQYLKYIKEEQARAHICPKQAKPLFLTKIYVIASYIKRQQARDDLSLRERFVLARDQAMFKLQFFAGDRASDVAQVLAQEIKVLPDNSGFVFNHTFGKTLRGGDGKVNTFVIKRCNDQLICPIAGLEEYLTWARRFGVDLSTGFLFRPVARDDRVLDESISYSAIYERLKTYLSTLGINEGETPHSMRSGCAVTLELSGSAKTSGEMMQHIGWFSESSAGYYSRRAKLIDSGVVAGRLARSVENTQVIENMYRQHADFDNLENAL